MKHRLYCTAAVIAGLWLLAVPAAGQIPAAPPKASAANTWAPVFTPDGQPDIQGIWEGGAGFQDKGAERVQTNIGPVSDCKALGSPVGTVCAAYPAFWTRAQGTGLVDEDQSNRPAAPSRPRGLVDLPDGKLPWTPDGKAKYLDIAQNFYDPPSLGHVDPSVRCMLPGIRLGAGPYQLLQVPGYVVMVIESNHATRIIPLDGRPHVGSDIRLFMGDSVGRWEGRTLVVDTTNYTGTGWYDMVGTPQSNALRTIERFTIVDANTIDYTVTIDDRKLFTRPWTYAGSFTKTKGDAVQTTELFEMACAEGSRSLEHAMERPDKPLPPEQLLPR